jgi:hypothetical protein
MQLQLAAPRQRVRLLEVEDTGNSVLDVVVDVLRQCVLWQVDKRGKGRAEQKGESLMLES